MKKKSKKEESSNVREEMICYQHRVDRDGVTRMVTQEVLDNECITLAESKKRIIEKVHNHYCNS